MTISLRKARYDMWNVIYLWRGERHHGGQYASVEAANTACDAFRAKGFRSWVEEV